MLIIPTTNKLKTMKKTLMRAYERPEAEMLDFIVESSFLILSVTGKDQDPVGGAEEGETDDWEWN